MIVTKLLLAALGLSAYAVAQGQDIQDQDVQYEDVVLDAWPMDPNNVLPTGTVTVRWDVKNGRDLEWSYNRAWCYNQATRYIQGYTIWADRYVSIDTWEYVNPVLASFEW
ncbi:hypothetical protein CNMCM8980_001948 [Aspergillus fumigatiaffinis]|nr:hypothetical protein CNMCM8980_001948 [Aspergillus fumigatiaffinis]